MTLTDRILAVLDVLGIARAHVATQLAGDIAGLAAAHPDRMAGVALVAPTRIDPTAFAGLGERLLYIRPEGGMLARTAASALPQLPAAQTALLEGYAAEGWTDLGADRPDLVDRIAAHMTAIGGADTGSGPEQSGEVADIRYHVLGQGPVLLLTPMALAPSQWEPLLPALAERFRVVALAGPKLGMLALLEERAALADWRRMCASLFDDLALAPGASVLDVGCGSGAVAIQFARHTGGRNPLTALDLSPYLLGEARIAAAKADAAIAFAPGSAETLPFAADSFDAAYTITVLEECDAAKALAELKRVVKPGGRVAVVVRATEMHQWWNLPVSPETRARFSLPAQSVSAAGVASAKLYDLALAAGLEPVRMGPYTVSSERTDGPVLGQPEAYALSLLTPAERKEYFAAKAEAIAAGTFFMTRGHHVFVGTVPG
ncbi:MAG: methyltransferase domain-containing protein [Alphaproteobacteria bacterium]|nr:methyltransferase domain-containing protein [Alphaproteobacteria bacterium]MCB9931636.1 methyltransferase domain-containing protein [Alphaproteobacteria bacterium]